MTGNYEQQSGQKNMTKIKQINNTVTYETFYFVYMEISAVLWLLTGSE